MNKKICLLLVSVIILFTLPLLANNISINGDVTVTDISTSSHYANLQFDISWDNSWKDATNYDAAWVFAKWKLHSGTDWAHCTLAETGHTNPTGTPSGVTIDGQSDGMGVFIYRSANGTGTNTWDDAKLRWNYGTDVADDATVDVKVFAIEMVYIPQGSFSLYDGESADLISNFNSNNIISSEAAIAIGGITWDVSESTWSGAQTNDGETGGCAALGTSYPKGFDAIYCMKYEISQAQYADFLSLLTDAQDGNRYPNSNGSYRHTISGSYGSYSASVPNRACNYLQWADGLAYADWAGLRPMTELEYEKICRGSETADTDYAWGSTTISGLETDPGNRVQNDGLPNESSTSSSDNCHYNNKLAWNTGGGPYGPVRCGFFAESGTSRETSGASYYGVMEMSGNLWERCITVAKYCWNNSTWNNETGAGSFDGLHGNGSLSATGFADVSNWPSPTVTSGYTAYGSSFRGASWNNSATSLRVSYRSSAANPNAHRFSNYGFRAVRTL